MGKVDLMHPGLLREQQTKTKHKNVSVLKTTRDAHLEEKINSLPTSNLLSIVENLRNYPNYSAVPESVSGPECLSFVSIFWAVTPVI